MGTNISRLPLGFQYHGGAFKVALPYQWMVVISGAELIEDLRKRPDSEVSFLDAVEEVRFSWSPIP